MRPMKRSKFSEKQVAYALRQAESGTAVGDVCRQIWHCYNCHRSHTGVQAWPSVSRIGLHGDNLLRFHG